MDVVPTKSIAKKNVPAKIKAQAEEEDEDEKALAALMNW